MRIIILSILVLLTGFNLVGAYQEEDILEQKSKYKKVLEIKFKNKISNISHEKKKYLVSLIYDKIEVFKSNKKLSEKEKIKYVSVFSALAEMVRENIREKLIITIIEDKRCKECETKTVVDQLESVDYLDGAEIVIKDFKDKGIKEYLKKNSIKYLPAVVFNKTNISPEIDDFLVELTPYDYNLNVGSTYDPFIKRSDRGFYVLNKEIINNFAKDSYVRGNKDAEISWIEYSDLECPFCARIVTDGTLGELEAKYTSSLNIIFQHFPLSFHKNAMNAAIAMECVGELSGIEDYYSLKNSIFLEGNVSEEFLLETSSSIGVDIESCLMDNDYKEEIDIQVSRGVELFGVSGTPANVLVNNKTGEYSVITGAQPASKFIEVIDSLMVSDENE